MAVLFEESILSVLPATVFVLVVPFQLFILLRRRIHIKRNGLYVCKQVGIWVYTALQLVLLVVVARGQSRSSMSLASAALSLVAGLVLSVLSHLEHVKSIRPSFLISLFLIVTVLFDVVRVRTRWLLGRDDVVAGVLTASVAMKCVVLSTEAVQKRGLLQLQSFSMESTSGFISRSFFWWLTPLLRDGFKRVLSLDDLPAIHEKLDSGRLGHKLRWRWDNFHPGGQARKHALAYACIRSHLVDISAIALPKFCAVAFSISQTFLVKSAVEFVQAKDDDLTWINGYGLIGAFALVYFGLAITTGWAAHLTFRLMSMMRGELTTVIYAKLLSLPNISESAALTLIGTDVQRISQTFHFALIDSVPSAAQLGIGIYLLYAQIGAVCIAPIIVTLVSTALSSGLTGLVTPRQTAWVDSVQKRLSYTTEILGSMRNVKILGLTAQMFTNVQSLRDEEMETYKRYELVHALTTALANLPGILNQLLVFAAYSVVAKLQGTDGITVSQAMVSLALLNLIDTPLSELIYAVPLGWSAMGCFTRIQAFLLKDSRADSRSIQDMVSGGPSGDLGTSVEGGLEPRALKQSSGQHLVKVENGYFGWSDSAPDMVKDVNITIPLGTKLILIVGPIGCGKTTLLRGLLGETPKTGGHVSISTSEIAYCDQTPWIMNTSIRANILSGADYDDGWYRIVIESCALDTDFRLLSEGDATVVGSKGMKLSGGQKQRISIARAIYSRSEVVICDDVLSGLDSVTEETVFRRVFATTGILQTMNKSVILATHSVKYLRQADSVLALDLHGRVVGQGRGADLSLLPTYIHHLEATTADTDDKISAVDSIDGGKSQIGKQPHGTSLDQSRRKTGDWSTYKYYMQALGWWRMAMFLLLVAVNQLFAGFQYVWLNWWASSNDNGSDDRLGYWLGLFAFMATMNGLALTLAIWLLWVYINPLAGSFLHRSLLQSVASAPLAFFSATDTGILVNRFSQDLRLADMSIPGSLTNVVFQLGSSLVVMALCISAVGYFAIVLLPVAVVLYFVQRFYLRTSRQLRLLEIEANAPIFTHLIESLNGLVTIRAFGWVRTFTSTNKQLLDASQRPYYLLLCIQRWLVLVLDLIVAALAVVLVSIAVALRSKTDAGFLGLALVNIMSLSHALANLVQHWTSLETSMGAIARIKDFSENTPSESAPGETSSPTPAWPTGGSLRFEGVSASYDGTTAVLQDVTFTVDKGQKIGIVGRTGSGKSSLTLAILRMLDLSSGKILIDDMDISTLPGSVVRDKLSCLTQEPLLFPATVRFNIDPWSNATDQEIVAALQKLSLWGVIQSKATDQTAGNHEVLNTVMSRDSLSHGQRQLFCLARAILKPGRMLILDEPTSSVDAETEAKMHQVIRSEFPYHTIVMIAHRVSSLLDFDRVLVLDGAKVVEFGSPAELLQRSDGEFSRLYKGSEER